MRSSRILRIALFGGAGMVLAACSDLTDIQNPGIVQPESENNAVGASAFYAGGVRQFAAATQNSIMFAALFADEWINGAQFGGIDSRRPQTSVDQTGQELTEYNYTLVSLRAAITQLKQFAPTPASRIGQMYAYEGYMELFIAEQFCNGIPIGDVDFSGNVTHSAALTTIEVYNRAIAHFDSAATFGVDSARIVNFARVGKGRALLGLAKYPEASAAVAAVPTNFVFNLDINAAVAGQQNTLYTFGFLNRRTGVGPGAEGINGINWLASADPRVKVAANGNTLDGLRPIWAYQVYNGLGVPVVLASGNEARLIQAEAALQANNNDAATTGAGWLGTLNSLRATSITPALTPLADPGTYAARVDLLFREKAFWTFLTGNRMADMRRLVRQYGRTQDKVFPTGTYLDGQPYGSEVNFEPPAAELPNTGYSGCIDRKA